MSGLHFRFKHIITLSAIAVFVFGYFTPQVFAANGINRTINFQGKVVDKTAGTNVADGNYDFTFKLYSASSGGSPLWTENWTAAGGGQLAVTNGMFQVALGSSTTFTSAGVNFNTDSLYLEITFNGQTMTSRIRLAAVPYAINAETVNGLTVTNTSNNPFSSATTLKLGDGKTVIFNNTLTFSGTDSTTFTLPTATDTLVGQASTDTLTNKTIGTGGLTFVAATTTAGSAQLHLTSSAGNNPGTPANGDLWWNGTNLYFNNGSTNKDLLAGGSSAWSGLTAPTGNLSMNMYQSVGTSFSTTFTYGNATSTTNLFNITDTASNTGTGYMFNLATATGSTLNPFHVSAAGTEALFVASTGNVGIGTTSLGAFKVTLAGNLNLTSGNALYIAGNQVLSANTLTLGLTGSGSPGLITLNTGNAAKTAPTISADSNGNLTVTTTQSGATTTVGSGTGNLGIALTGSTDQVIATKTYTLAAAYSVNDYQFQRTLTGATNSIGGSVLYAYDNSTWTTPTTVNTDLILGNEAGSGTTTFTGNLLRLQRSSVDEFLVDGSGNASASGTLTIGNGSRIQPAYGSLNFGYKSGANAWSTGMVLTDAGNVGIGMTAPLAWLDLTAATTAKAQINLSTSGGTNVSTPNSGDLWWNGTNLYFYNGSTNKDLLVATASSPAWSGLTAPTTSLSINMYQTVGTSFATTFTYGNATSTTNLFNLTDTTSNTGTGYLLNLNTASSSTLKPFHVSAAGTEALIVNASGNVGIGTTAPTSTLYVKPTVTASAGIAQGVTISGGTLTAVANNDVLRTMHMNSMTFSVGTGLTGVQVEGLHIDPSSFTKSGTGTIAMTYGLYVDSVGTIGTNNYAAVFKSGNVGIGTTAPGYPLAVVGAGQPAYFGSTGSNNARVVLDNQAGAQQSGLDFQDAGVSKWQVLKNTNNTFSIFDSTNSTDRLNITSAGVVTLGSGTNGLTFDPANGGTTYTGTARSTKQIILSPEFAGAVLTASGSASTNGSMTSDASPSATWGAGTNNWMNYYQWTTTAGTMQDYTVAVRVTLPQDFSAWTTSNAVQIYYNTNLTTSNTNKMDVAIFSAASATQTPVVYSQANASSSTKTWTTLSFSNANLTGSPSWNGPGQTAVFYIKLYATQNNYVQLGDIILNYLSKF